MSFYFDSFRQFLLIGGADPAAIALNISQLASISQFRTASVTYYPVEIAVQATAYIYISLLSLSLSLNFFFFFVLILHFITS